VSLFSAQHITKRFADRLVLDDVSVNINRGHIFGLLGPNGAGKTTLIRIMNRIIAPDSGTCLFKGHALESADTAFIGYMPEERGLYRKMGVSEHILYLARLKGMNPQEARKELNAWIERFEMHAWRHKKVEELSKGMQQKVQFVATVIHRPELLILDEPFSGFDPVNADLVKNEILRLKAEGTTLVLSTHSMASVEELCDDIAMINGGRCVLHGSVHEIREQNKSGEYEILFRGNMVTFTSALWAGGTILSQTNLGADLWKVRLRLSPQANVNGILSELIHKVEIKGLQEYLPGMHEIFVNLVKSDGTAQVSAGYTE
jgi:ABC-2 type transport system ATP-binding protein